MYGVPDFYQNDNVKKGTGMQWRHQVVSDLPTEEGSFSGQAFEFPNFQITSAAHPCCKQCDCEC